MFNSRALTKIQSIILIAIIVVTSVGGVVAYVLFSKEEQSSETIKIGVMTELTVAKANELWQAVVLAAEQLNATGGIMGRQVEVIGEDTSIGKGMDSMKMSFALTRLLTQIKGTNKYRINKGVGIRRYANQMYNYYTRQMLTREIQEQYEQDSRVKEVKNIIFERDGNQVKIIVKVVSNLYGEFEIEV